MKNQNQQNLPNMPQIQNNSISIQQKPQNQVNEENQQMLQQIQEIKYDRFGLKNMKKKFVKIGNIKISLKKLRESSMSNYHKNQFLQKIQQIIDLNLSEQNKNQRLFTVLMSIESLPYITELKITTIFLKWLNFQKQREVKYFTQIPRQMTTVYFSNLWELGLNQQKITNIERLIYINAPNLKRMLLDRNKITNINCLTKSNFLNLDQLALVSNPLIYTENFYRVKSSKLSFLAIDNKVNFDLNPNDIRFLSKLQPYDDPFGRCIRLNSPLHRKTLSYKFYDRLKQINYQLYGI